MTPKKTIDTGAERLAHEVVVDGDGPRRLRVRVIYGTPLSPERSFLATAPPQRGMGSQGRQFKSSNVRAHLINHSFGAEDRPTPRLAHGYKATGLCTFTLVLHLTRLKTQKKYRNKRHVLPGH